MRIYTVDIGGTFIKSGVFESGIISDLNATPTDANLGTDHIVGIISKLIGESNPVDAIAISTRGQVDFYHGVIIYDTPDVIPDYSGTPLRKIFEDKFNIPVVIENDVNCAAVGEGTYGAAKNIPDYLCLTYGTSIGGAIIFNHNLNRGYSQSAGEFGMMAFPDDSSPQGFSTYEKYASVSALISLAQEYRCDLSDGRKIVSEINDKAVSDIISTWCRRVGIGIISLIHIFNPSTIILGGGIMENEEIIERISEYVKSSVSPNFSNVNLISAKLGNTAGIIGAAIITEKTLERKQEVIKSDENN